jgi:acyl-CoA reductase-like NAD-dependent aldehyde dehydrogenase
MLSWKVAPALATLQHRRPEAPRRRPDCAPLLRRAAPGGAATRVVNLITGDGSTSAALVDAESTRLVHRPTEVGRRSSTGLRQRHKLTLELAARPQHRLRRRRARPGRRGDRQRDLLQPGTSVAGSRLFVQVGYEPVIEKLKKRMATRGSATRSTRTPTSVRSTRASSSTGSRKPCRQ